MNQMRMMILVVTAACGHNNVLSDANVDGKHIDAHAFPPTLTIRGTARARTSTGHTPVAGVTVAAYENLTTAVATTTTDPEGVYALTITTNGSPVAVYLKTTSPSYVDTYLYFPESLSGDASFVFLDMFTPAAYALVYSSTGVTQVRDTAMLELAAVDGYGGPLSGATFGSYPSGTVKYTANGVPDRNAMVTGVDGVGFVLDVTPGDVVIDSTSPTTAFAQPITVRGFANSLTMAKVIAKFGGD
jgi:hypothetical protein